MTLYEYGLALEAYDYRQEQKQQEIITNAWLSAHYNRVKKMPDLKKEINYSEQKKEMTDKQILNSLKTICQTMGGKVRYADSKKSNS